MKLRVKQLLGEPADIILKDGTILKKQMFSAEDGKTYVTFAKVSVGEEYDGTVEVDTRSGELRFKKTKVPFTPRNGGGESNRQTALKAAATFCASEPATNTHLVEMAAERFLKWLEAGSPGTGGSPLPLATQEVPSPAPPADLPPVENYDSM